VVKDQFDQHLPCGNKVMGSTSTKKLGIVMVVLCCLFVGCQGLEQEMQLTAGKAVTFGISTVKKN
jgi:hypothetical protein